MAPIAVCVVHTNISHSAHHYAELVLPLNCSAALLLDHDT